MNCDINVNLIKKFEENNIFFYNCLLNAEF